MKIIKRYVTFLFILHEAYNPARLRRALGRLPELATAKGLMLEVAFYGGAVFALVWIFPF